MSMLTSKMALAELLRFIFLLIMGILYVWAQESAYCIHLFRNQVEFVLQICTMG